jgi:hypothetical protein
MVNVGNVKEDSLMKEFEDILDIKPQPPMPLHPKSQE